MSERERATVQVAVIAFICWSTLVFGRAVDISRPAKQPQLTHSPCRLRSISGRVLRHPLIPQQLVPDPGPAGTSSRESLVSFCVWLFASGTRRATPARTAAALLWFGWRSQPPTDRSRFIYTFNFILRPSASTSISDLAIFACCCCVFFFLSAFHQLETLPCRPLCFFLVRRPFELVSTCVFLLRCGNCEKRPIAPIWVRYMGGQARSPTRECFGNFSPN